VLPNQTRREWKLVQLDFAQSMAKSPSCLHDGNFIMNFYICHPKDIQLPSNHQRYWLEYHKLLSPKRLHVQYHLIQPSDLSPKIATSENLVPYREWVNLKDPAINLNGPIEFATINNRKTRDKISTKDWSLLSQRQDQYDNHCPSIRDHHAHSIQWNEPIHSSHSSDNVSMRVSSFVNNLVYEINDTITSQFEL
jgi:hypothetical protein